MSGWSGIVAQGALECDRRFGEALLLRQLLRGFELPGGTLGDGLERLRARRRGNGREHLLQRDLRPGGINSHLSLIGARLKRRHHLLRRGAHGTGPEHHKHRRQDPGQSGRQATCHDNLTLGSARRR